MTKCPFWECSRGLQFIKQFVVKTCQFLWCYRCVGTHPGCNEPFDWRWYWSYTCPSWSDKCVKIIEKKGVDTVITRDCLSNLISTRRDIPGDTYEGCRAASEDVKLAQYTFNDIRELDIKRTHFDNTTWCFCSFDHFCNSAKSTGPFFITFFALMFTARLLA
nr:EOG090X0I2F [Artemia franciscana]